MYVLTVMICLAGTDMATCTRENARYTSAGTRCGSPTECQLIGSIIARDHPPVTGEFVKFVVETAASKTNE